MKKLVHIFLEVFLTAAMFLSWQASAQSPEKISYQAVIRDAFNNLVRSQTVSVQISILKGTEDGDAIIIM